MKGFVDFDPRSIGRRMPRLRYQRGSLRTSVPAHGGRLERSLPRGQYWSQWYAYVNTQDGKEVRRKREKIITRELAETFRIAISYSGPLTKTDAQRVLDLLIAKDTGAFTPPDHQATVAMVAREYLALAQPNWGAHMVRAAGNLEKHIIAGKLGQQPIARLSETDLQRWLNEYVNAGASRSLLKGLLLQIRAIFKHARKRKIISEDPTEDLRAKSKKRPSERYLSVDECRRLMAVLTGRDHLIVRMLIQLGLRPEELFALRRDDVQLDQLRIDEAVVLGKSASVKTEASAAYVYIPHEVRVELDGWLSRPGSARDWLFQTTHGRPGHLNPNNYRERILQPAAIRAGVGLIDTGKKDRRGKPVFKTDVDFRALRRTCATLFGDRAKDPKSTQAQLRHADPTVTLKHYQKSIPATVRLAGDQLERDLAFGLPPIPPR
jgi:integrase